MSLRPRYSLLTLLVLTAFIAGGVKLWYGPHHVVERPTPDDEWEYTYTRDWRGNRVIEGPRINRFTNTNHYLHIKYFRNGVDLDWIYQCRVVPRETDPSYSQWPIKHTDDPFSAAERLAFQQTIQQEQERLRAANKKCHDEFEGNEIFTYFNLYKR